MSGTDWDARAYHRISNPQFAWGLQVLDRLALSGDEVVLDAGCGTGRLTAELLARHPEARVIALDGSEAMLSEARAFLEPRFGDRVRFVREDLQTLDENPQLHAKADLVFSTATFHWIKDHARLFVGLFRTLTPGGRVVAQCGGQGNIARVRARAAALMRAEPFATHFVGWSEPWHYAAAEETEARLHAAGFSEARAWMEDAPVLFDSATPFREFVEKVIVRDALARLATPELRSSFLNALVDSARKDRPAFELDYRRLTFEARRGDTLH